MREQSDVTAPIREMIVGMWPGRFSPGALREDVALGEEGLGLDSLEVVQLIFACEDRWERPVNEALYTTPPLTIGRLAREFAGV